MATKPGRAEEAYILRKQLTVARRNATRLNNLAVASNNDASAIHKAVKAGILVADLSAKLLDTQE